MALTVVEGGRQIMDDRNVRLVLAGLCAMLGVWIVFAIAFRVGYVTAAMDLDGLFGKGNVPVREDTKAE